MRVRVRVWVGATGRNSHLWVGTVWLGARWVRLWVSEGVGEVGWALA